MISALTSCPRARPTLPARAKKSEPGVCRSLGDGDLKECGVVALPEVTHTTLTPDDSCLVLASDGLWDKLSSQDVADLIRDTVKDPTMCAQRLATEAITRGSGGACSPCWGLAGVSMSPIQ